MTTPSGSSHPSVSVRNAVAHRDGNRCWLCTIGPGFVPEVAYLLGAANYSEVSCIADRGSVRCAQIILSMTYIGGCTSSHHT